MLRYVVFIALMLAANLAFIYYGGWVWLDALRDASTTPLPIHSEINDAFAFTLEDEVLKKVGQPIEGFEPAMFIQVFPGLTETDFEGVEASSGHYYMKEGKLTFALTDDKLVSSASGAITRNGMSTLLTNVATRARIDLTRDGTLTDVMRVITARQD